MINHKKKHLRVIYLIGIVVFIGLVMACKKNLPDPYLSLGSDAVFLEKTYRPILGRNTLFKDNFITKTTSLPLNFKIVNLTRYNGEPAPELLDFYQVLVWKQPYLGNEKSFEEIEAKRVYESHQLFEIRQHSGQFLMWAAATSNFVKTELDSGYVFDVEVSNTGGRRYFQNFRLIPRREVDYEPNPNGYDPITGHATTVNISPDIVTGVNGERTNKLLGSGDIDMLMQRVERTADFNPPSPYEGAHSLTIKVVDKDFNPIHLDNFNTTDWKNLVHGFDMKYMGDSVIYKVAYPIPLANIPTKYSTSDGTEATINLTYSRVGFGNIRRDALIAYNFRIFRPGDWIITFRFSGETPKFDND